MFPQLQYNQASLFHLPDILQTNSDITEYTGPRHGRCGNGQTHGETVNKPHLTSHAIQKSDCESVFALPMLTVKRKFPPKNRLGRPVTSPCRTQGRATPFKKTPAQDRGSS